MVKRTNPNSTTNLDKLNSLDGAAFRDRSLSSGNFRSSDNILNDDLIVSLADAYENRRARQVNEWERQQYVSTVF